MIKKYCDVCGTSEKVKTYEIDLYNSDLQRQRCEKIELCDSCADEHIRPFEEFLVKCRRIREERSYGVENLSEGA